MAYSDFTLKLVKAEFNLQTIEDQDIFLQTPRLQISPYLKETLDRNVPLARMALPLSISLVVNP